MRGSGCREQGRPARVLTAMPHASAALRPEVRHDAGPSRFLGRLLRRAAVEFGPLLLFFALYATTGLPRATAAYMAAVGLVAGLSWSRHRRLPVMPFVGTVFVLLFGGLTLATRDAYWILVRPTVVNALLSLILFASVAAGRPALRLVLGGSLPVSERGWRGLSLIVATFLAALAVLNEVVWRTLGVDAWVLFKTFGMVPLNLAFAVALWPYVKRRLVPDRALSLLRRDTVPPRHGVGEEGQELRIGAGRDVAVALDVVAARARAEGDRHPP